MKKLSIEIKARTTDPDRIRAILQDQSAEFVGEDHQRDTYFRARHGRLKLREGEIENSLIHYQREISSAPKRSDVTLYHPEPGTALKTILTEALGVDIIVEKRREIYFIENVKFHIDDIDGLGRFVEIEAIDNDGIHGVEHLRSQCREYLELFDVQPDDLIAESYSDMLR